MIQVIKKTSIATTLLFGTFLLLYLLGKLCIMIGITPGAEKGILLFGETVAIGLFIATPAAVLIGGIFVLAYGVGELLLEEDVSKVIEREKKKIEREQILQREGLDFNP